MTLVSGRTALPTPAGVQDVYKRQRVYFVEDDRRQLHAPGQQGFEGQHDAGKLAARSDPLDGLGLSLIHICQPGSVIYAAFGKQSSGQTSEEIQRYDLLAALDA